MKPPKPKRHLWLVAQRISRDKSWKDVFHELTTPKTDNVLGFDVMRPGVTSPLNEHLGIT